jgi:catechol 2,3-dioxygenase-like lactoylglutathione lyase family enzyme
VIPTFRVARPTDRLASVTRFYCEALGFERLASFQDHDGFDGEVLGYPGAPWHLEFVHERGGPIAGTAPSEEHLLALYFGTPAEYEAAVARAEGAGAEPMPAHNPYWDRIGRTYADPDGYRVVLVNSPWPRRT